MWTNAILHCLFLQDYQFRIRNELLCECVYLTHIVHWHIWIYKHMTYYLCVDTANGSSILFALFFIRRIVLNKKKNVNNNKYRWKCIDFVYY